MGLQTEGLISGWAYKQRGLYPGGLISGWAYKQRGLYPGGLISGIKKMFRKDEIKRI